MKIREYALRILLAVLIPAALAACTDDIIEDKGNGDGPDDVLRVGASVYPADNTRSYIEEGTVTEGTYYLLYRQPGTSASTTYYNNALVEFGDAEGPSTGFAYFMDGDTRKDLKWRHVYGEGSSQTFYLSNIPTDIYTTSSLSTWNHFRFNVAGKNPYVAGLLDVENGTNDIVFGSKSAGSSVGKIEFDLNHVLSLLKVNLEVYSASDGFLVDLSNAKVTISNVATTVGSFQLNDPTNFKYNTSATASVTTGTYMNIVPEFTLIEPGDGEDGYSWDSVEDGVPGEGYEDYRMKVYTTKRIVMPPQSLPPHTGTARPKLSVTVPKADVMGSEGVDGYVTYSGYIPDVMFAADAAGNITNPSPETISFKSGYQLNITASINSPETDLTFAPVKVEAWIGKTSASMNVHQAGIYNARDFRALYTFFRNGDIDELERYGYMMPDGSFAFQFWANVTLDEQEVTDCMKYIGGLLNEEVDFSFIFNGYAVSLANADGEITRVLKDGKGQEDLYNIVSGQNRQEYLGIYSEEDFSTLFDLCLESDPSIEEMCRYGYINNTDNTFVFDIRENINLDIEKYFMKLPAKIDGYDIAYDIEDGYMVKVYLPGEDGTHYIECRGDDYIDKLSIITEYTSTPGFSTPENFQFLVECYNNYYRYYNPIFGLYAVLSKDGAWTLYVNSTDLELDGNVAFLSMIPNGDDKPNYGMNYRDTNAAITIANEWMSVWDRRGPSYWQAMFSGSGKTSNLTNTMSLYTSKNLNDLWGSAYFKDGVWYVRFTSTLVTATYDNVFGKMIPDPANGKYDYVFIFSGDFTLTGVPVSEGSTETQDLLLSGEDGAETLKQVASGTYWNKR